jgi:hypothetical protein
MGKQGVSESRNGYVEDVVTPRGVGTRAAMQRRALLLGMGLLPVTALIPSTAHATLVLGLSLRQLVNRARHVVVMTPLESVSSRALLGERSCIVTDTRVRVEDALTGSQPAQELTVRTLGGRIGNVGELVHGQPLLVPNTAAVAFLTTDAAAQHWFVGMAQGHYPLRGELERTLQHSPNLPEIRDFQRSAVKTLSGLSLGRARQLIREAVER